MTAGEALKAVHKPTLTKEERAAGLFLSKGTGKKILHKKLNLDSAKHNLKEESAALLNQTWNPTTPVGPESDFVRVRDWFEDRKSAVEETKRLGAAAEELEDRVIRDLEGVRDFILDWRAFM